MNSQVSLEWRWTHRRITQRIESLVRTFDDIELAIFSAQPNGCVLATFVASFLDQARDFFQLSRANDNINKGRLFENQLLIFLSHAAHHTDDLVRMFFLFVLESTKGAVRFVFRLFANAAGVEQNRIGIRNAAGELISLTAQVSHNHFTVEHIHLATNSIDVQSVHGLGYGGHLANRGIGFESENFGPLM